MHGRPRKGRPSANYKWISARLDKLSDDEVKRLIGVLVERLSVEDLARMLSGLPVIIRRKKDSLPG